MSLGQLHAEPEFAVPALMSDFSNNHRQLPRSLVLISLGQFGAKAKESLPMVVAALIYLSVAF
jgi:hypothetical protein